MMVKLVILLTILILASGCVTSQGHGPAFHGSEVKLTDNNFTVEKQNIEGEASVTTLFDFSFLTGFFRLYGGQGPAIETVNGIALGNSDLIANAAENLKANAGIAKGSKRHLVNMAHDYKRTTWIPFILSTTSAKITADVIEFK